MDARLVSLCRRVLGAAPTRVETFSAGPGGAERGTRRVHVEDRVVYATRRQSAAVAEKEARVLRSLSEHGGPVPRFLAFEEGWLLQESAGGERLAQTLQRASDPTALLTAAVEGLRSIQRIGAEHGLADAVTPFARGDEVATRLLSTLREVGELAGVPAPALEEPALRELVGRPGDAFVKWDARPGNAAVGTDGRVRWFDWQHTNVRHPGDDLVWLLCDETIPDAVPASDLLVATAVEWCDSAERVCALGVVHVATRLHGALTGPTGLDVSWEECLRNDWLGSRETVQRLCLRGAAVAARSATAKPLAAWYGALATALAAA